MLADERAMFILEDADGAGHGLVTIFVDDLDAAVGEIAARGLEPDERLTYSNGVRKAIYRDPDGNEIGFGGAPLDDGCSGHGDAVPRSAATARHYFSTLLPVRRRRRAGGGRRRRSLPRGRRWGGRRSAIARGGGRRSVP